MNKYFYPKTRYKNTNMEKYAKSMSKCDFLFKTFHIKPLGNKSINVDALKCI